MMIASPYRFRLAVAGLSICCLNAEVWAATQVPPPSIPQSAANAAAFVPKGWQQEALVETDWNGDKREDVAIVIQKKDEDGYIDRVLVLALRDQEGTLRRSAVSDEAVLDGDEGGFFGDPFVGIKAERGALVIEHYGGSN